MRRIRPAASLVSAAVAWLSAASPGPVFADDLIAMTSQLANHMMSVQPTIQNGRVTAIPRYPNRNMSSSSKSPSQDRSEELRLDTLNGTVNVRYKLSMPTLAVDLNLSQGRDLKILKYPQNDSTVPRVEIHQPREGAIMITGIQAAPSTGATGTSATGTGEKPGVKPAEEIVEPRKFESVWHLFLIEPEFARKEVEPLFGLLRSGWQLSTLARGVEDQLLNHAANTREFDRRQWAEMVEKLGSDTFVDRESADRSLRELGRVIVPYLKNLDASRLDAEQLHRVRAILRRYTGHDVEDSPATVADWLAGDPDIWVALAERSTPSQRTTIRSQLSGLLGEAVVLDESADAATLAEQIAAIRVQVERYRRR